jgi:hypothetical protein
VIAPYASGPVYVESFVGAGATWLRLLDPSLVGLCSWMGGKRRDADAHLSLLDLVPGRPVPALLGDASWWGWVWPTLLDPVTGPEVAAQLRFWRERGDDPRQLWFALREAGPLPSRAEAAAQLLWLQARAASGVPVWWEESGRMVAMSGRGDLQRPGCKDPVREEVAPPLTGCSSSGHPGSGADDVRTACAKGFHGGPGRLLQHASTQIDEAGQSRVTVGTREAVAEQGRLLCDHEPPGIAGGGGIVDPSTIARRADAIRTRLVKASGGEAGICGNDGFRRKHGWRLFEPSDVADRADRIRAAVIGDVRIEHRDALEQAEEWAPRLGDRARVLLDGPYAGKTGYPATCSRDRYLRIGETWARHGAPVVMCEAVPLAEDLGRGWEAVQLRDEEWVTTFGCDARAHLPALWRAMGAA